MPPSSPPLTTEEMQRELLAAGWVSETNVQWRSPSGEMFLGARQAWKEMKIFMKRPLFVITCPTALTEAQCVHVETAIADKLKACGVVDPSVMILESGMTMLPLRDTNLPGGYGDA